MDTPGSDISLDSADSPARLLSPPDSRTAQNGTQYERPIQAPAAQNISVINNDGSESDVSMSADSDDEDEDGLISSVADVGAAPPLDAIRSPTEISRKRKWPESTGHTPKAYIRSEDPDDLRKRVKAHSPDQRHITLVRASQGKRPVLPAELWQNIFTFCHPRSLGRLLRVNKSFNACLDPSSSEVSIVPISKSALRVLMPDVVWQASRRLFLPGMPTPIAGKSELDMWRLASSVPCQFCHKNPPKAIPPTDQWHRGPGENGVVPIWSFGIRTCGSCLQQQTSKEIDLLLSSSFPSPLLAALPFVFLTNELHIIIPSTLQTGQQPPGIQIIKHFSKQQVCEIKHQFHEAKAMGSATVEEWLKGLEDQGKERKTDSSRWERWETSGGIFRMLHLEPEGAAETRNDRSLPPSKHFPQPPLQTTTNTAMVAQVHELPQRVLQHPSAQPHQMPPITQSSLQRQIPPRYDSPAQNGFGGIPPRPQPLPKQERTKDEVAALKVARRAEIERRCMLLNPPLTAGVLAHMTSFQAAIQIIQPLDDSAWDVLKPRLLSQRDEAEQRENDRLAQTRVVLERYQDPQIKSEFRDLVDQEWDDIQAPLRARIGGYADEIVRDGWNDGAKVTKDEAPRFAAEVLIYVRKRFYAEVAKDEAAVRAAGRVPEMDPPNGPYTRTLTLENMKWIFDAKVKPYTEQYRKELFLCSACENNFKYYGFEGVIQHYAAKHTSALSNGSVVVCWKSEWPEYPPFNPEPDAARNSYYSTAPSTSALYVNPGQPQHYGYGGYQQPVSAPPQALNPHVYQESPGPYYGHPHYSEQYMAHQNGPFAPPSQVYPEVPQGYPPSQYPVAAAPHTHMTYHDPPPLDYSHQVFDGPYPASYPASSHGNYATSHPAPRYPPLVQEHTAPSKVHAPQGAQYGQAYVQPLAAAPSHTQGPYRSEEYKSQLLDVARNAREVWNAVSSVKEVSGSIKVYTILHYLLKRARDASQGDPPLSMIIDGLSSNKDMRPIRNINGLLCKACTLGMPGSTSAMLKKHYSFPQLLNHFNGVHAQASSFGGSPDWTTDMIELPDFSKMTSVKTASGINDEKLRFFTDALPEILAPPSPVEEDLLDVRPQRYEDSGNLDPHRNAPPSQDNHGKYYAADGSGVPSESSSTPYASNQYDPHNPREPPVPPRESTAIYRPARRLSDDQGRELVREPEPLYTFKRERNERESVYRPQAPGSYTPHAVISPPSRDLQAEGHGAVVVRGEAPIYVDHRGTYRATGGYQYRVQRGGTSYVLDESSPKPDFRPSNSQSYQANRADVPPISIRRTPSRDQGFQDASDTIAQQNHIFEVMARISQQAQQARERQSAREDPVEAGSEDGELHGDASTKPVTGSVQAPNAGSNEAERFLNDLQPRKGAEAKANTAEIVARREGIEKEAPAWGADRVDVLQNSYQPPMEQHQRFRGIYHEDSVLVKTGPPSPNEVDPHNYLVRGRAPPARQSSQYGYDDRYISAAPDQAVLRERSPELVDRRYMLNNVVYREEIPGSHSAHRAPGRYARYESARLENDRARSRSPVYVNIGPPPGQYRERSPSTRPVHHDPIYRARSPPVAEGSAYERAPRPEYYRVYADEPRSRQPQYADAFEYVQVSDPQGGFMVRRPVRREPEPIYSRYEDEIYARQPVCETRAPVSRSDPSYFVEEYDPRHPAPPPMAQARQVRYQ